VLVVLISIENIPHEIVIKSVLNKPEKKLFWREDMNAVDFGVNYVGRKMPGFFQMEMVKVRINAVSFGY
jgi:hypothetical protein